eukprot:CAMPEP_0119276204 /NCGR_PEP_ID=MMETSP1329-20130426/15039_1 /TAXON_ID=114041 /ORGANISM="Genus nov. species nov., Strain RCC1024" /LENGTH=107 /DNA_ID=CAMNT_0007276631 /DNA_START=164 /DNA_END=484 /DNA_ORIENTATION=+
MDIRITGVEDASDGGGSYSAYVLTITKGAKTWTVKHRYSSFDDLRKTVSREMGSLSAAFPGKSMFGRADPQKRRGQLEEWVRELADSVAPPAAVSAALADFVKEPAD